MNALQKILTDQFGPGNYLTNSGIDRNDVVSFEPAIPARPRSFHDRIIDRRLLPYGEAGLSIGFNRSALVYGPYDGISVFGQVLKQPGETRHSVPRQLESLTPVLKQIADHEFATSPTAVDKACRMALRVLPLKADVKQVAQDVWHTHGIATEMTVERGTMLDIDAGMLATLKNVSPNIVQNEYIFSDRAGTLYQSEKSPYPMSVKSTGGDTILVMAPERHRQAAPHEIIRMTSYVFHAAARPEPKDLGHTRTMLLVCYTGTPALEARLRASL